MTEAATLEATAARRWTLLTLLVAAISLPFLGKAFHIDDTFFLQISANVLSNPLDPFAGVIDWGGVRRPMWQLASNPPLLSYYLAPVVALSGGSEVWLHLSMLPFLLLLAGGTHSLARRFGAQPWLTTLFVMTSAGVVVSVNLMRDVPATALGVAAIAAVVSATDRRKPGLLWCGFVLAGLALLTRFNSIVFVAVAVAYPLLSGRRRDLWPALVPLAMLLLWSLHNQIVYGETQLLAQMGRGHNRPLHAWRDNLAALPLVVGSLLYLAPALCWRAIQRRDGVAAIALAVVAATLTFGLHSYLRGWADAQYWLWSLLGGALLCFAVLEGLRPGSATKQAAGKLVDARFLLLWLSMQLVLGVVVSPYPAVRHLVPALVPLCLLSLRYWRDLDSPRPFGLPAILLALQAIISMAVASADAQLANSYRDFAQRAVDGEPADTETWFVGHWGWQHYAEAAGLKQLHAAGAAPHPGDRLIVPTQVEQGLALEKRPVLKRSLKKLGNRDYKSSIPLRSVHDSGAGFYALFSGRNTGRLPGLPYRWLPESLVERFEIYEVRESSEPQGP